MIEVSPNGALVSSVSIAAANPNSPGGVALGPASTGSGVSIYVGDRGVDNNEVPSENDGKIYEFSTGGSTGSAPVADFSWAQSVGSFTVVFSDGSANNPTDWLWDFDPASGDDGSSAPQPSYTYPGPGTYTVTLTATNSFGSDTVSKPVTVTTEPPPPTGNLLENGGFESDVNGNGQPDNWTANASFTQSAAISPREGSFVGRHATAGEATYNVESDAAVVGGEQYVISGWINAPTNADRFKFLIKIKWRGPSGNIATVTVAKFTDDTAGGWVPFTGTVTAPSTATSARVMMTVNGLTGTVYVDDFVLQQAP